MHPLYRHAAFSLGREVPAEEQRLREPGPIGVLRLQQL